ncbi:MAG: HAD family hydrolase [Pseudomonadota bacterium]
MTELVKDAALDAATAAKVAGWSFVLATDLDGTFLGGTPSDRAQLYHWIGKQRDRIGLVFVTGRDPGFIEGLCADTPVPWPDFVVGDVGTTIARMEPPGPGGKVTPIAAMEAQIAALWGDAGAAVRKRLDGHPGLTLQPTDFRHRVSYDYDPKTFDDGAKGIVEEMGHDWLISADRYFDVLPKGVSKGPSLRRLIDYLGVRPNRVLAAGDTMNDYSMLVEGFPSVAVGGSEPALLAALPDHAAIVRPPGVGAGGIMDAVAHFALHHPTPR